MMQPTMIFRTGGRQLLLVMAAVVLGVTSFGAPASADHKPPEFTVENGYYRLADAASSCTNDQAETTLRLEHRVAFGTMGVERPQIITVEPAASSRVDPELLGTTGIIAFPSLGNQEVALTGLPDRETEVDLSFNDTGVFSRRTLPATGCDPAEDSPGEGTITVSVWHDRDGNGVRSDNEPLVDNPLITVWTALADGTLLETIWNRVVDTAGRHVISGLGIGTRYVVTVDLRPGESFTAPNPVGDAHGSGIDQATGRSAVIVLPTPGSEVHVVAGITIDADASFAAANRALAWGFGCSSGTGPLTSLGGFVRLGLPTTGSFRPSVTIDVTGLPPKTGLNTAARTARPDGVYEVTASINDRPAGTRIIEFACSGEEPTARDLATRECVIDGRPLDSLLAAADCESLNRVRGSFVDSGAAPGWTDVDDPCDWRGIRCEYDTVLGHDVVRHAMLSGPNFAGTLNPAIGELSQLEILSITGTELAGALPSTLGNARRLMYLLIEDNAFSGPIPAELGLLSELKHLSLEANAFTGSIPAELAGARLLEKVNLSHNQLSGPIPGELGRLQVSELLLNDNQLSGTIPAGLADLSNARLSLQRNQLEGRVPSEFHAAARDSGLWFDATINNVTGLLTAAYGRAGLPDTAASFEILCHEEQGTIALTFHDGIRTERQIRNGEIGTAPSLTLNNLMLEGEQYARVDIEEFIVRHVPDGQYTIDIALTEVLAAGVNNIRLTQLLNGQHYEVNCESPPSPTAVVNVQCINNDGAVVVDVDNPSDSAVTATLEVSGLSARSAVVESGDATRLLRTGRPDGQYQVVVSLDDDIVHSTTEAISCDPNPLEGLAVELTNRCVAGNGLIVAVVINDSPAEATATLRITGLAPRSTTIAPATSERLIRSGRPDGTYRVELDINGLRVVDRPEVVECDPDPEPGGEVEVDLRSRCVAGNGALFARVVNNSNQTAQATLRVTGLAPRTASVNGGSEVTLSRTGRPDNTYRVTVAIDGAIAVERDEVIDCDPDPVDQRNGVLGNRVWIDGNANALQDFDEPGLGGVTVTLWLADGDGSPQSVVDRTSTNADGAWSFTDVSRLDTHVVQFSRPDGFAFVTALSGPVGIDSTPTPSTGITGPIRLGTTRTNNTIDAGLRRLG